MQKKIIIGLTGQSGAGKSTVAKIFAEYQFQIIDADKVAREVTALSDTVYLLSKMFGHHILNADGSLNRKELAAIVFSNKNELTKMNNLLFPIIIEKIQECIAKSSHKYIMLDAPQLFESGLHEICDSIISVIAPRNILIERICKRDNINEETATKRLNSQFSEQHFIDNSQYVIRSDGNYQNLKNQIDIIARDIRKEVDVFEF